MGVDTQTTDFTVVGIGDMSGDVFGNGMLLSPHIKLVAAFDHRHIFLDPQSRSRRQSGRAWAPLRRSTFQLGRLRPGADLGRAAACFRARPRRSALSAAVQAVLGISAAALAPNELIRAILQAPVDLLYNGGIGTYVKASRETHAQVGDRANDACA